MPCDDWPRVWIVNFQYHCSVHICWHCYFTRFDIRVVVTFRTKYQIRRLWPSEWGACRKTLMWSISLDSNVCDHVSFIIFSYAYKLHNENEIPRNTFANLSIRQFCMPYVKQYACGARYPTKIIIQRRLPSSYVPRIPNSLSYNEFSPYARRRRQHTR